MSRAALLVPIKVSPEVGDGLLIASAVVIVLALVTAFVRRFGKKGWLAVGSLVALLAVGAGALLLARRAGLEARNEAKLAGIRKVVSAVSALAADTAPAEGPLRSACLSSGTSVGLPAAGGSVFGRASSITPTSMTLTNLDRGLALESSFDPTRALAPSTTLYDLPFTAEAVAESSLVIVVHDGATASGTWRGTVSARNLATGKSCKGRVEVPAPAGTGQHEMTDERFLLALCKETGASCGR